LTVPAGAAAPSTCPSHATVFTICALNSSGADNVYCSPAGWLGNN